MTRWTSDELARIGAADELEVAARRPDGTLRNPVTIWVVPYGDDLYVRSVNGRDGAWFRGVERTREGRIRAGGIERDVSFADAGQGVDEELDGAYRRKYRRYATNIVDSMLTAGARATTVKLVPR